MRSAISRKRLPSKWTDTPSAGDTLFLSAATRFADEQRAHSRSIVLFRTLFTAVVVALLGSSSLALASPGTMVFQPDTADIIAAKADPMMAGITLIALVIATGIVGLLLRRR